eukprot:552426-Amphidinium_carterae.1
MLVNPGIIQGVPALRINTVGCHSNMLEPNLCANGICKVSCMAKILLFDAGEAGKGGSLTTASIKRRLSTKCCNLCIGRGIPCFLSRVLASNCGLY